MIKHYAVVTATFPNPNNGGKPVYEIDHGILVNTFGGVAQDMDTGEWLTTSHLGSDENQDDKFLAVLSEAVAIANEARH